MASLDENLYSRQIAVYGKESNNKLSESKVIVFGFDGTSLELCKNLILGGVKTLNIISKNKVDIKSICTNYFTSKDDIDKMTLNVVKDKLSELNPHTNIEINNNDPKTIYDVYILVNNNLKNAIEINKIAKENNKNFIWANSRGLMGNIFCDFNNFISSDIDGENKFSSVLSSISSEGIFTTIESDPHNLYVCDKFKISEIVGLDINENIFTIKKVIDKFNFEIEEEIDFDKYKSGGRITQEKKSIIFEHKSLEESIDDPNFINLDDVNDLHLLFLKSIGYKNEVTKYDKYLNTLDSEFGPICGIIGSIATQEAIKAITNKYTPISQWYYHNCYDLYPSDFDMTFSQNNDHNDNMRELFGDDLFNEIKNKKVFIVGAGAIGCELLKYLSMTGIGQITITDMDTIEKSNLNRQFLFRNSDIGKLKSKVAASKIMEMNSLCNVIAHENKICTETENIYNCDFFNENDIVANALDNKEARLYVDQRCIFYKKPLFESGTLGMKGNTQVIIPELTEYYGESQDEKEKSFPLCTIKNFPNSIEHVIPWAREDFEELFNTCPNAWNKYINDPSYINEITGNEQGEMIRNILYLWNNKCLYFSDCVLFAIKRFYEKFNHNIKDLINAYPKDMMTSSGASFWSGGKRCPIPLDLDIKNKIIKDYVYHTSFLICEIFNIEPNYDVIDDIISTHVPSEYVSNKNLKISSDDKEEEENQRSNLNTFNISDLPKFEDMKAIKIKAIEFEKDDDTNHHIDYINCSTNLRALNYDIPTIDRYDTKIIAGKIIPAIATTTSIVAGLVSIEILKYIFGKNKLEDFKNTYLNLGLGMIMQSEPMPCSYNNIKDKKVSIWNYYELKEDVTIKELFEQLSSFYDLEIDTIMYESKLIVSPLSNNNDRLDMKISKIIEYFDIELKDKIIEFQIDCLMEEEDYDLPNIKYFR